MNETPAPRGISIRHALRPGDVDSLASLHGALYAEEYGWDATFEEYVSGPLEAFASSGNDGGKIWIVEEGDTIKGSIAIVRHSSDAAQLRWFLLHPSARGRGIGKYLIGEAVHFCREEGYRTVFLWTVSDLKAAAHLYSGAGFRVKEEKTHRLWGALVTEQRYELSLL